MSLLTLLQFKAALQKTSTMEFYHGTGARFLDAILKKGLLPRQTLGHLGSHQYKNLSNPRMVYLADNEYMARTLAQTFNEGLILKVHITSVSNLYPDENSLSDILDRVVVPEEKRFRHLEVPLAEMLAKGLNSYPDQLIVPVWGIQENLQSYWRHGLKLDGTVCHKGPIPPKNIVAYKVGNGPWVENTPGGLKDRDRAKHTYMALEAMEKVLGGEGVREATRNLDHLLASMLETIFAYFADPSVSRQDKIAKYNEIRSKMLAKL